jgi:hypothetical protein
MKARRHPILGFFAGLLLGLGVTLMLFMMGVIVLNLPMLGIITFAGALLGVLLAYIAPVRGRKPAA